jgi:anti-sigma factor RsiW
MTRCDSISDSLTAWIDGELSSPEEREVALHVADCSSCAQQADRLREAIDWQTQSLPGRLLEDPVDVGVLRMGMQRRLSALREQDEPTSSRTWAWLIRPLAMASAGLALASILMFWRAAEPESLLVSLGVEEPPADLATRPEMFKYLEVIENLEALEHFEAVQAVRLEDERAHLDDVRQG